MPTEYQFTGQRNIADIGLYFYNARFYDASLGRFISADTIVPAGVQGLDRYAYTLNNPVNFIDPSGHRSCSTRQANTGDETCWQNVWKEYKQEKQQELDDYVNERYEDYTNKPRQLFAPDINGETVTPRSDAELWQFVEAGNLTVRTIVENDLGAGCSCNDLASSAFGVTDMNGSGEMEFDEYVSKFDYSYFISEETSLVIFTRAKRKDPLHIALVVSVNMSDPEQTILIQTNSGDLERGVYFTTIGSNYFRPYLDELIFLHVGVHPSAR